MMKKPVLYQRLGHLFNTTSHEWCRMGSSNSWFAISSLGTNSPYIKQWTWSSHMIYAVIHFFIFRMIWLSSWKFLVCFDIVSIVSCLITPYNRFSEILVYFVLLQRVFANNEFGFCSAMRNCGINPLVLGWSAWCSVLQTRILLTGHILKVHDSPTVITVFGCVEHDTAW